MIDQDRPKVDLAFSWAIGDSDRRALLEALETEGLALGKVGNFETRAIGPEPLQVWITLYEQGVVLGLGAATVGGAIQAFKAAWRRWRNHFRDQRRQLPAANLRVGTATYTLPEEEPEAAIDAIPADQATPESPKGDRMWDPEVGWEGVIEHWTRIGREEAEERQRSQADSVPDD